MGHSKGPLGFLQTLLNPSLDLTARGAYGSPESNNNRSQGRISENEFLGGVTAKVGMGMGRGVDSIGACFLG